MSENEDKIKQMVRERVVQQTGREHLPVEEHEIGNAYAALEAHPWQGGVLLTPEAAERINDMLSDLEVERRALIDMLSEAMGSAQALNGDAPPRAKHPELGAEHVYLLAERMYAIVMDVDENIACELKDEPLVERERWMAAARVALELCECGYPIRKVHAGGAGCRDYRGGR